MFTICLFPVCFTVCFFISPDLDGNRAPEGINPPRPRRSRNPNLGTKTRRVCLDTKNVVMVGDRLPEISFVLNRKANEMGVDRRPSSRLHG
jgi:hypothetical protein